MLRLLDVHIAATSTRRFASVNRHGVGLTRPNAALSLARRCQAVIALLVLSAFFKQNPKSARPLPYRAAPSRLATPHSDRRAPTTPSAMPAAASAIVPRMIEPLTSPRVECRSPGDAASHRTRSMRRSRAPRAITRTRGCAAPRRELSAGPSLTRSTVASMRGTRHERCPEW